MNWAFALLADEATEEEKKKKESQLKQNPLIFSSDMSLNQADRRSYAGMISMGVSKSSMTGAESFGLTSMIWTTLDQFAVSGSYTKMGFKEGKLNTINNYSFTTAYLKGNYMSLAGYTWIKPHPKYGTFGYNLGIITLMIPSERTLDVKTGTTKKVVDVSLSTSAVAFWTKPFPVNKRLAVSPQLFLMTSPIGWNTYTGETTINRNFGGIFGSSWDLKLTKKFGFNLSHKLIYSGTPDTPLLNSFQMGGRFAL